MVNIRGVVSLTRFKSVLSRFNYSRAWFLWFVQNIILLIVMVLFIVNYFTLALWYDTESTFLVNLYLLLNLLLDILVILAFILDLSVVMIIILIFLKLYRNLTRSSQDSGISRIIVVSGICWIVISIVWRLPVILPGTPSPGFGVYSYFVYSFLNPEIVTPVPILLSVSGLLLFIFLKYQDVFFSSEEIFPYSRTGYGLFILVGDLILSLITMFFPDYYFFALLFVTKLGVTPLIGMLVAHRIFTEEKEILDRSGVHQIVGLSNGQ